MNMTYTSDHTMRELFEYPDPSVPFIVWTGDFRTFADHAIECHWHNEFEYGVLLSGEVDYYIDGQYLRVRQGDAVFINADAMHKAKQVDQHGDAVIFTVSFLPSLFPGGRTGTLFRKFFQPVLQSSFRGFPIRSASQTGGRIVRLLHEIYDLSNQQPEDYELMSISLISRLWSFTLGYIREYRNDFCSFSVEQEQEQKTKDILSYIQNHYAEDIHIEDIVRHAFISRSELFRSFGRYMNQSPIEYLTEYRLAHAANLLRETDKSVTQIAVECGFSNASYFGKIFKKKHGVSPLQFKNAATLGGLHVKGAKTLRGTVQAGG